MSTKTKTEKAEAPKVEEHATFAAALAAAQSEMEAPRKVSTNPHFKSKFAPLDEIVRVVTPALTRHGIAYMQDVSTTEQGRVSCAVRFLWGDQSIEVCSLSAKLDRDNAQGVGSAVTYLRRYTLAAACGVAPDDDDDGNAASGSGGRSRGANRPAPNGQAVVPTDVLLDAIAGAMDVPALETLIPDLKRAPDSDRDRLRAAYAARSEELRA